MPLYNPPLATPVSVSNGGTGQSSYTDGQLLIGNSSGNGLTKATLTAGSNVTITNGNGSISIAATGGASSALNIVSKTTTYTATTSDDLILCSGSAFTVTLYAASGNSGKQIRFKKTDSSTANTITIDGNGSETIDGALTYTLDVQYEEVTLVCDGSNWYVLEKYVPAIIAKYYQSSGQSISNNTITILNFDTSEINNNFTVTTGASWSAAIPKAGKYEIKCASVINISGSPTGVNLYLYKNTAAADLFNRDIATSSDTFGVVGSTIISFAKGDTLDARIKQGSGLSQNTSSAIDSAHCTYISIEWVGL
jgi:hypothetical protein